MKDDRVGILLYSDMETPAHWFMCWSYCNFSMPVVTDQFVLHPREYACEHAEQLLKLFPRVDLIPAHLLKRRKLSAPDVVVPSE